MRTDTSIDWASLRTGLATAFLDEAQELASAYAERLDGETSNDALDIDMFLRSTSKPDEQKYLVANLVAQKLEAHEDTLRSWTLQDYQARVDVRHADAVLTGFQLAHAAASGPKLSPKDPPLASRYRIAEHIGQGGFATLYKAHDQRLDDMFVTVKLLHIAKLSSHFKYFSNDSEMRIAARLSDHPGVVSIHDFCSCWLGRCLVYKYVDGSEIDQWAADKTWQQIVEVVGKVASTLHEAHREDVYHYDISPANILVDRNDQPRLIDLGLAMDLEELMVTPFVTRGTQAYMAPELRGMASHLHFGKPDVFSLTAVLYELLGGKIAVSPDQRTAHFRPLREKRDLPAQLVDVIEGVLLQENPDRRIIQTAYELREELLGMPLGAPTSRATQQQQPEQSGTGLIVYYSGRTGVLPGDVVIADEFVPRDAALGQLDERVRPNTVVPVIGEPLSGKSALVGQYLKQVGGGGRRRLGRHSPIALLNMSCQTCTRQNDLFDRLSHIAGLQPDWGNRSESPHGPDDVGDEFDDVLAMEEQTDALEQLMADLSQQLRGCKLLAVFDQCPRRSESPEFWQDLEALLAHRVFRAGTAIVISEQMELSEVRRRNIAAPVVVGPLSLPEAVDAIRPSFARASADDISYCFENLAKEIRYPHWIITGIQLYKRKHKSLELLPLELAEHVLESYYRADDCIERLCGSDLLDANGGLSPLGSLMVAAAIADYPLSNEILEDAGLPTLPYRALTSNELATRIDDGCYKLSRIVVEKLRRRMTGVLESGGVGSTKLVESIITLIKSETGQQDEDIDQSVSEAIHECVDWLTRKSQVSSSLEHELLETLLPLLVNDRFLRIDAAKFRSLAADGHVLSPRSLVSVSIINAIVAAKFGDSRSEFLDAVEACVPAVSRVPYVSGMQLRSLDLALFFGARRFRCVDAVYEWRRKLLFDIQESITREESGHDVRLLKWSASWALNTAAMGLVDQDVTMSNVREELDIAHHLLFDIQGVEKGASQTARRSRWWLLSRYHSLKAQLALRLNDVNGQVKSQTKAVDLARKAFATTGSSRCHDKTWWLGYLLRLVRRLIQCIQDDEERLDHADHAVAAIQDRYGAANTWSFDIRGRVAAMWHDVAVRLGDPEQRQIAADEALDLFDSDDEARLRDSARGGDSRGLITVARIWAMKARCCRWTGDYQLAHQHFSKAFSLLDDPQIKRNGSLRLWKLILDLSDEMNRLEDSRVWDFDSAGMLPHQLTPEMRALISECREWLNSNYGKGWRNGPLALRLEQLRWRVEGSLHHISQLYAKHGTDWRKFAGANVTYQHDPREREFLYLDREEKDQILASLHQDRMRHLQGIERDHGGFPELYLERAFREAQYQRLRALRIHYSKYSLRDVFTYYQQALEKWPHSLAVREAQCHFRRYVWQFTEAIRGYRELLEVSNSGDHKRSISKQLAETLLTVTANRLSDESNGVQESNEDRVDEADALIRQVVKTGVPSIEEGILQQRIQLEHDFINNKVTDWEDFDDSYKLVMDDAFVQRFVENNRNIRSRQRNLSPSDRKAYHALVREPTRFTVLEQIGKLYLRYSEILFMQGDKANALTYSRQTYELLRTAAMFQEIWGGERSVTRFLRARSLLVGIEASQSANPFHGPAIEMDMLEYRNTKNQLQLARRLFQATRNVALGLFYHEVDYRFRYVHWLRFNVDKLQIPVGVTGYQHWRATFESAARARKQRQV